VAGLLSPGADIATQFDAIASRMVELASGDYIDSPDAREFDVVMAAGDAELGVAIPPAQDLAGIRRRSIYAPVYLVHRDGQLQQIILPVYGSGLWSTMYGYLALADDGNTVTGLRFYDHAETPGLGDQVDDPDWRKLWVGKQVYDDGPLPRITVIRGPVPQGVSADSTRFQIDGLSGATLTGRGVTHLVQYWTGPHAFGPFLQQFQQPDGSNR
jgi:Na+-transporting NADH:ubiquinone oxidoreductase subunit C